MRNCVHCKSCNLSEGHVFTHFCLVISVKGVGQPSK